MSDSSIDNYNPNPLLEVEGGLSPEVLDQTYIALQKAVIPVVILNHSEPIISTKDKIASIQTREQEIKDQIQNQGIRLICNRLEITATRTLTCEFKYNGDSYPFLVTTVGISHLSRIEMRAAAYNALVGYDILEEPSLIPTDTGLLTSIEAWDISNKALKRDLRLGAGIDIGHIGMGKGYVGPLLPPRSNIPHVFIYRHIEGYTKTPVVDIALSQKSSIILPYHKLSTFFYHYSRNTGNRFIALSSPHNFNRYPDLEI